MKSRPFKSLIRPYAVVRWHGRKVGQEEIVRPSLNPLFCSSPKCPPNQSMRATSTGGQLCFGGQPYIFRLTPANGSGFPAMCPLNTKLVLLLISTLPKVTCMSLRRTSTYFWTSNPGEPDGKLFTCILLYAPCTATRRHFKQCLRKVSSSRVAEETIELNVSSLKLSGIAGRAARSREARGRDGAIRVRKFQQSRHHQPDAAHRVGSVAWWL